MSDEPPISILIVEDGALIRFDMEGHLRDRGFRVFEAATADEAIDILAAEPSIRLMFTYVDMPKAAADGD